MTTVLLSPGRNIATLADGSCLSHHRLIQPHAEQCQTSWQQGKHCSTDERAEVLPDQIRKHNLTKVSDQRPRAFIFTTAPAGLHPTIG